MTEQEQREFDDLKAQVAYLQREFDRTLAAMVSIGQHAGVELGAAPEPEPMGQLLVLPDRAPQGTRKRAAGSAVPLTAPRRASTPGRAS